MTHKNKFKQTEIGEIPEGRTSHKLSEIMEIIGGGTPKTTVEEYWGGEIPWLSVVDFGGGNRWVHKTEKTITKKGLEESSTNILKKGQVVISARGTVGEIAQLGCDMAFNQSCYGLDGKQSLVINDFLYYLLKTSVKELKRNTHGAVFDTITRQTFDCINVSIPALTEQRAIAKILTGLDEKIELNLQMNRTLESIAQAIFKRWFVDFEFPGDSRRPYKSSGGKMIDSELGKIPERWKAGAIGDIAQILSGFAFKSSDFVDNGRYRLVTIKNVQDGYFDGLTKSSLNSLPSKMPEYCRLQSGDILLSLTGNVGRICLVAGDSYLLNQRVAKLAPINKIDNGFVYLLFRQQKMLAVLENMSSGTAQQNLSPIKTADIDIILPERSIMEKFGKIVNPMINTLLDNINQNIVLTEIRDSLLPKLMAGKIMVYKE